MYILFFLLARPLWKSAIAEGVSVNKYSFNNFNNLIIVRFELLYIRRQNHTRYIFKARGDRIFVLNTRRIIRFKLLHREKHNIFLDKLDHPAKEVISMLAPPSGEGNN